MKYCSECGAERPDDERYCSFCGTEFFTKPAAEEVTDLGTTPPPTEIRTGVEGINPPPASTRNPDFICYGIIAVIIVILIAMLAFSIGGIEFGPTMATNLVLITVVVVVVIIISFSLIFSRRRSYCDCDCCCDCCYYSRSGSPGNVGSCDCGNCDCCSGSCDCGNCCGSGSGCDCGDCCGSGGGCDCGDCGECGECAGCCDCDC